MRYIMPIVEQLDRAARELVTDHPINNRLALILVDNATELVLHMCCTTHVRFAKEYLKLGEEKLSPSQRRMALGPYLDGKLRVLHDLGEITEDERRFVTICHDYRNELYHVGLKHEKVIRAVAGKYYELACNLFGRLQPAFVIWSSTDQFTEVGRRYLAKANDGKIFPLEVGKLAPVLLAERPEVHALPTALVRAADDSIDNLEKSFEFIVNDNPAELESDDLLKKIQFHYDFLARVEKDGIEGSNWDPAYRQRISDLHNEMRKSWRSRHKRIPLDNWRRRAKAVGVETDELRALAIYQALRNDMLYLEDAVGEAAAGLDAWIQGETDRARGK